MDAAQARAFLSRVVAAPRGGPWAPSSDFDLDAALGNPPRPRAERLRPAAILVAADLSGPRARLVLTQRAAHLRHHPGQAACPGGRLEPGEDAVEAALREAHEEVGLPSGAAEVLGTFGPHETVTGFEVTAVVAAIAAPVAYAPQEEEVAEVFFIPLAHAADLSSYRVEGRVWGGRHRRYWILPHGPHYVWGATARMLRAMAERGAA